MVGRLEADGRDGRHLLIGMVVSVYCLRKEKWLWDGIKSCGIVGGIELIEFASRIVSTQGLRLPTIP